MGRASAPWLFLALVCVCVGVALRASVAQASDDLGDDIAEPYADPENEPVDGAMLAAMLDGEGLSDDLGFGPGEGGDRDPGEPGTAISSQECEYEKPEDELNKPEAGLPVCPEDACSSGCATLIGHMHPTTHTQ